MGSNGGNLIRLEEINRIRSKLEKDIDARKTLSARYRKILQYFTWNFNRIKLNQCGYCWSDYCCITKPNHCYPNGRNKCHFSGCQCSYKPLEQTCVVSVLKKHSKLGLMGNNTLIRINQLLSESLKDGKISDSEFKAVLEEYQEFLRISNNMKDVFTRRTFVEKDEIKKKVNEVFESS